MKCPRCAYKLTKDAVAVVTEYDFDHKAMDFVLKRKIALCPYCGKELGSKSFN